MLDLKGKVLTRLHNLPQVLFHALKLEAILHNTYVFCFPNSLKISLRLGELMYQTTKKQPQVMVGKSTSFYFLVLEICIDDRL